MVANDTLTVAPGATRTRRRRLKTGSRTGPTVLEAGRPSMTATGSWTSVRGRGSAPGRVSYSTARDRFRGDDVRGPQWVVARLCAAGASASQAGRSGRYSVWTNRLENAGCAMSAAGGARTTREYDVISISRGRGPLLLIDRRRTRRRLRGRQGSPANWTACRRVVDPRAVFEKYRFVAIRARRGRVDSVGGPDAAAGHVAQVQIAAPGIAGDILAPARHGEVAPDAVARPAAVTITA